MGFGRVLDDEDVGGSVGVEAGSAYGGSAFGWTRRSEYLLRKGTLARIRFCGK